MPADDLPPRAPAPAARTLAFAVVSIAFGLIAHTTTSHSLPPVWLIALGFVVIAATARPMAALEHRLPTLLVGLFTAQLILHAAFILQSTGRANSSAAGWLCCGSDGAPVLRRTTESPQLLDRAALVQLGVHMLAALVIAAVLRVRERSAWTLARAAAERAVTTLRELVGSLIALLAGGATTPDRPLTLRAQARRSTPAPVRTVLLDARAPRRGPPACPVSGALSFA